MSFSPNANWLAAFESAGVEPVYLVTLFAGPSGFLTMRVFSEGSGDTVTVTWDGPNAGSTVFTEGVDFNAVTDNETTASNIASANDNTAGNVFAFAFGERVVWVPNLRFGDGITTITVASSDTAAWDADPEPVPQSISMVSGARNLFGYPNNVSSITPVAHSLNPVSREHNLSSIEIEFNDDGLIRLILARTLLRNKRIDISIGTHELAEDDFVQLGSWFVDEVFPDYGSITFNCLEPVGLVAEQDVNALYLNMHPFAILRNVLESLGLSSGYYNASSFDETNAAYSTSVSHWALTKTNWKPRLDPEEIGNPSGYDYAPAHEVIRELLTLIDASLIQRNDGVYDIVLYDDQVAAVDSWTEADVSDFEQTSTYANAKVSFEVFGGKTSHYVSLKNPDLLLRATDDIAVALMQSRGSNPREVVERIESGWLGSWAGLGTFLEPSTTTMKVVFPDYAGMSGTRVNGEWSTSQRPTDTPDSNRIVYLLLTDGQRSEYISATGYTPGVSHIYYTANHNTTGIENVISDPSISWVASVGEFTGITRDITGTGALEWTNFPFIGGGGADIAASFVSWAVRIYDVTIPWYIIQRRLARFSHGAPVVRLRTTLEKIGVEIGDFVSLTHPNYIAFDHDGQLGFSNAVIFEVTRKEVDVSGDSPGISWELVWVRNAYPRLFAPTYTTPPVNVTTSATNPFTDISGAPYADTDGSWYYPI